MAELAVGGSLLLMVLAVLVRYGMMYTANQRLRMEVFRSALQQAYSSTDGKGVSVTAYKDIGVADPQDMFGFGSRQVISSSADVMWSNNPGKSWPTPESSPNPENNWEKFTQWLIKKILALLEAETGSASGEKPTPPSTKFWFINNKGAVQEREYTVAKYMEGVTPDWIEVSYPFYNNDLTISSSQMMADEQYRLKILVSTQGEAYCQEHYCPTDVISSADVEHDDSEEGVVQAQGPKGGVSLVTLDSQEGELDTAKMDVNEGINTYQGVLYNPTVKTERHDTLTVTNSGGSAGASSSINEQTTVDYQLRLNKGGGDQVTVTSVDGS